MLIHTSKNWNGTGYDNYAQDLYTYDINNNKLSYIENGWDETSNSWTIQSEEYDTYNANNNILSYLFKYSNQGVVFEKDSTNYYYKNNSAGISQYSNLNNKISIYPNPSSGIFTIEINSTTKQIMQVYDINGRIVLTQTINGKATIDMTNLPAGVYNINLLSNEGVVNKRVVISK